MRAFAVAILVVLAAWCVAPAPRAHAQKKGGGVAFKDPQPSSSPSTSSSGNTSAGSGSGGGRGVKKEGHRSGRGSTSGSNRNGDGSHSPGCDSAEVVVRCGIAGCAVSADGELVETTGDRGELSFGLPGGTHNLTVEAQGYEVERVALPVACSRQNVWEVKLRPRVAALRLRIEPAGANVSVNGKPRGPTNEKGELAVTEAAPALLIEASKKGYLSTTKLVSDVRALAGRELVLKLEPVPATVLVTSNVSGARVRVKGRTEERSAGEKFFLPPGSHTLTVEALGYEPSQLELELEPDGAVTREVPLKRLPAAQLLALAEQLYRARSYQDVLTLCGYIFEEDAAQAGAHRLAGLSRLAQSDYARAEQEIARALEGGARVELRVRRHPRESFDPVKGHDVCEGLLILGKSEVEFQGQQYPADNFVVPYAQVQVQGLQLKQNSVVYLGTKVTDAHGRRRDFNFYSFDRELSQSGRPYLEMLQRLLRAH